MPPKTEQNTHSSNDGVEESEKEQQEEDPVEETAAFIEIVRDRLTTQHHSVGLPPHMNDGERGLWDA